MSLYGLGPSPPNASTTSHRESKVAADLRLNISGPNTTAAHIKNATSAQNHNESLTEGNVGENGASRAASPKLDTSSLCEDQPDIALTENDEQFRLRDIPAHATVS